MHLKNLLFAVLVLGALDANSQHSDENHNPLKVAEVEAAYSPHEHQFMVNTNGLVGFNHIKATWFYEYNLTNGFQDYSVSLDPKIYGPLHLSFSFENDLFGIHPEKNHFQTGIKFYMQEIEWFTKPFLNCNVGLNYSTYGTAEHRVGGVEVSYMLLTHPMWINKNFGIVFQSSGRIRNGHDFLLFQGGVEYPKWHSILMLGTGQVYEGKLEFFVGLQYSVIADHKKFTL
ncbi:MAG: hypothetical protein WC089_01095 [Candidatus Paceibacterota bacterium]